MRKTPDSPARGKGALLSACRKYRYQLQREWDSKGKTCAFIGLNPSTADEINDDPTIRRCVQFAKTWGYGRLVMVNLFAYRCTDPAFLADLDNPVGKENDEHLISACRDADLIVAAWGNYGALLGRDTAVKHLLFELGLKLKCFQLTKQGRPGHPLFQPKTATLTDFNG